MPENNRQAVYWYTKAAQQGDTDAQFLLGIMYDEGDDVPEDKAQAVYWYTKAAEMGDETAQYNLALMYFYGEGVNEDKEKAAYWFSKAKAAEHGNAFAHYNLTMHSNKKGEGVSQPNL